MVTSFGVFSILLTLRNNLGEIKLITDLTGLKTHNKSKAIALLALFFSLAGIPPFAGFIAKLLLISVAYEANLYFSLAAMLIGVVISIFYFLLIFFNCHIDINLGCEYPMYTGHLYPTGLC